MWMQVSLACIRISEAALIVKADFFTDAERNIETLGTLINI